MICPHNQVVSIGDADPILYAPITDDGVTSCRAVSIIKARLTPGTTAIVRGVGGLGTFAIQFLRLQTNTTIYCVNVSERCLKTGVELGAKKGFVAGASVAEHILAETCGRCIDGILDFVGANTTMALSMKVSKPQGRIALVGMNMGTVEVGWSTMATGCEFAISLASNRQDLDEVCTLVSQGLLRIDIDRYPFEAVSRAYAALHDGLRKGRTVITFD
jgi:alcohol dehydrogenase, propanol-preferring